ncbi:MAG: DNA topoisomerase (ATP-hydrolyzing) subunit B [Candidatus Colwellbacteria bacterium]|nr:DNA topoisomerase (ATP-hydrolyzing) subunit B [Candidatus Colwellbacteria bacterium]
MANAKTPGNNYTAKDIQVLQGLDPVRKRPGMYVGSTESRGLHHILWEVFDNSIDEVMGGYANSIFVKLNKDGSVMVRDNGRGIPVDIHKQTKKSALETVMTTLHAGGKFGGEAYKVSGGLHGVGVSVVNALSKYMKAEVYKDGDLYVQEYERGKPKAKVKKIGKGSPDGTCITFIPDDQVFSVTEYDRKQVIDKFRQRAYLTKGVKVIFIDEREDSPFYYGFQFDGGLKSFIDYLNEDGAKPVHNNIFYIHKEQDGIDVEAALNYVDGIETTELAFANGINNIDGGMHLTGFRSALTKSINDYAKINNLLKKGEENLTGEDVREGLTAVISVKLRDPQFEGQTKGRLGNAEARTAVESVVSQALKDFLELNPNDAKAMVAKANLAAKARLAAKAAKDTVLRKGVLDGLTLPGKLADCLPSTKVEDAELFLVEGDSAGGSAKSARDRRTQAILPLRGKILNAEKHRIDKILANKEMISLVVAMGTAISEEFDISKLRYGKIIIMTDADVDGAHIRTLILTLFFRYFPKLIEERHLYIAEPPLYKITKGKVSEYAHSDDERDKKIKSMEGVGNVSVQRYKGLGEMNPDQLWDTTMDPAQRSMRVVTIEDAKEADRMFDILMGSEVDARKHFIQVHADSVKNLDI